MSFNDAKANGWFDGGDSPLAGWTMQLSVNGAVVTTTVTDALGNYAFPGLSAGTYLVCEVVQTGWRLTEPVTARACPGGFGYTVVVPTGLVQATSFGFNDFGNTTLP